PRRGRDHERALREKFGDVPLEDQVRGLKALGARYPELDLERVGIYGWSFGGYMSALAVMRRPDIFKVGVAGAPVVDWLYYDTHYTERYLGLPDDAPKAYASSSLLTYAKDLERPLLLVHGIADDNVYFAHTLQLADHLFRAGKDFDLLPLVGLTHQIADPSIRETLYGRMANFLGQVLWK
ncbi:MAG: prolyl oligopeptidase family serine peptidase, partial [Deltaproteobacteria bacterium]